MSKRQEFSFVEYAIGGSQRRNHVALSTDVPRLIAGDHDFGTPADCYTTYLRFREDLKGWVETHKNDRGFPTVTGYDGTALAEFLPFDFDAEEEPELALADARSLVQRLHDDHGVSLLGIRVAFSGSKGFSVEVPGSLFGGFPPARMSELVARFRRVATELTIGLTTTDPSIYTRMRLWRIINTRHSKTDLYKIPLTAKELALSIDELRRLAAQPRRIAAVMCERKPRPSLVALWKRSVRPTWLPKLTANGAYHRRRLDQHQGGGGHQPRGALGDLSVISLGRQHNTLRDFVNFQLGRGINPRIVLDAVRRLNAERLEYPAPDSHLVKIVKGGLKFQLRKMEECS